MVAVVVTGAGGDSCASSRDVMMTRPAAEVGLSGLSGVRSPLLIELARTVFNVLHRFGIFFLLLLPFNYKSLFFFILNLCPGPLAFSS